MHAALASLRTLFKSADLSTITRQKPLLEPARLIVALAAALEFCACASMSRPNWPVAMRADFAQRSPDIHWPHSFEPDAADVFASNQIVIHAPCDRVWSRLLAAPSWPEWYENARDVTIADGAKSLIAGSTFHWTTFGLGVESHVHEFTPPARLGWFGHTSGLDAYHTWLLRTVREGCHVVTEEVGIGPTAIELRRTKPAAIHRGHDLWLQNLKAVSERRQSTALAEPGSEQ